MLFNSELALVNRELSKKWLYLEPYRAQYSGQAYWMRILRHRIDRVMNVSAQGARGGCALCHRPAGVGRGGSPPEFPQESS